MNSGWGNMVTARDSVRTSAFDQNLARDTDGEKQRKCLFQTGNALPGNPSIIYFMISAL